MLDGDDDAPVPWEWRIGRLCEEFGCLPSEAMREIERVPFGFLGDIVLYRDYAKAKALYDGATTAEARKRLPESPLIDLVQEIEFEFAAEELDALNTSHATDD